MSKIINSNALDALKKLPDSCCRTCITSPPYYGLRDYGADGQIGLEDTPDQYIENLVRIFREVRRVLKDDGTLWVNIGDNYTQKNLNGIPWLLAFALKADGWDTPARRRSLPEKYPEGEKIRWRISWKGAKP